MSDEPKLTMTMTEIRKEISAGRAEGFQRMAEADVERIVRDIKLRREREMRPVMR